jgi:carbon monoxide dehydrogenase subunit G
MEYRTSISAAASADQAWAVLANLAEWPNWTPTVESIATDRPGPEVGQVVAVKQPGRRLAHYTIDVVEPGRRFRWGSSGSGVTQLADHVIIADGADSCTIELSFSMTGPIGGVMGRLGAAKAKRMVDAEAAGLRKRLAAERPS